MDTHQLFPNENIILTSNDQTIILTNRRIRQQTSSFGSANTTSIHLEKISSIEAHYKTWIYLLILGILLLLSGVYVGVKEGGDQTAIPVITGLICIVIYFITRRHIVTISSDGGAKINMLVEGMSNEGVINFIDKVEEAKNNLLNIIP